MTLAPWFFLLGGPPSRRRDETTTAQQQNPRLVALLLLLLLLPHSDVFRPCPHTKNSHPSEPPRRAASFSSWPRRAAFTPNQNPAPPPPPNHAKPCLFCGRVYYIQPAHMRRPLLVPPPLSLADLSLALAPCPRARARERETARAGACPRLINPHPTPRNPNSPPSLASPQRTTRVPLIYRASGGRPRSARGGGRPSRFFSLPPQNRRTQY